MIILFFYSACSSQNPGYIGRKLQNLTAHYNIYFNGRELLKETENKIKTSTVENYSQLLEVYPTPSEETSKDLTGTLNDVIKRANTIALNKSASNWVDDAYLLLAKAEYYKGNFYNSSEYFDYVNINYPGVKEAPNRLAALIGNAQANLAMEKFTEADTLLQAATQIKSKYHQSILNATLAQAAIDHDDNKAAVDYLKKAVKLCKNKYDKIRWTFILAQLEENIGANKDAYDHYSKVVKSNASFELSFMANLYRIKVKEGEKGITFDKIATLKKLLKDDKNLEYIDQIFYQIANAYLEKGKMDLALKNYKISANTNPGSPQQKGLSFLKLAEINFDSLKNYTQSQLYYDSTLQFLPKDHIGYESIAIKAKNLQYLAYRLQIVEQEDLLLNLAAMPDSARAKKINEMIALKIKAVRKQDSLANNELLPLNGFENKIQNSGTFYFNNSTAISQGVNEFKKRWGNRKLTDNWRLSSVAENASQASASILDPDQPNSNSAKKVAFNNNPDSLKANYLKDVPLLQADKDKANFKVLTALYEISNFYKDILNDNQASIKAFEEVLTRYPESIFTPSIYYQLYRLYSDLDKTKANFYKNLLLEKYPKTDFAKFITDPNFGKSKELLAAAKNIYYENLLDLYNKKSFTDVITKINEAKTTFSTDSTHQLPLQFVYLNALAIGNTQSITPYLAELENISKTYPKDTVYTPRVLEQISYINNHKPIFDNRQFALVPLPQEDGNLPEQIRYISPRENNYKFDDEYDAISTTKNVDVNKKDIKAKKVPITKEKIAKEPNPKPISGINADAQIAQLNTSKDLEDPKAVLKNIPVEVKKDPLPNIIKFETGVRQKQAIIINVLDRSLNIAKSFAGISKYFYSKFDPTTLTLVIKDLEKGNKLVIIKGNFYGTDRAQIVLDDFNSKVSEFMAMPPYKYNTFVISEENLKLITSQNALDQYLKYLKSEK
jgi:hypothetical protein